MIKFLEAVNNQFQTCQTPGSYLTLDEPNDKIIPLQHERQDKNDLETKTNW